MTREIHIKNKENLPWDAESFFIFYLSAQKSIETQKKNRIILVLKTGSMIFYNQSKRKIKKKTNKKQQTIQIRERKKIFEHKLDPNYRHFSRITFHL